MFTSAARFLLTLAAFFALLTTMWVSAASATTLSQSGRVPSTEGADMVFEPMVVHAHAHVVDMAPMVVHASHVVVGESTITHARTIDAEVSDVLTGSADVSFEVHMVTTQATDRHARALVCERRAMVQGMVGETVLVCDTVDTMVTGVRGVSEVAAR